VTESTKSNNDFPLEASMSDGGVPLESILCTEDLRRRAWRPPDYKKENRALVTLANSLADSKFNILQKLAETILEATESDSAGISLLTKGDGGKRFFWPAIAGIWKPHTGGGTPRNFGPCGDVLDRNCTLLFRHFERRYPYLLPVMPLAEECLSVPFYVGGKAVGTIWAIMHTDRRKFDGEDERLLSVLGQFASLAYQTLESIDDLKVQIAAREKSKIALRELANGLEAKVRCLVDANVMGIVIANLEGAITEANDAFLRIVQYRREDLVSGRVRWTDLTPPEWRVSPLSSNEFTPTTESDVIASSKKHFTRRRISKTNFGLFFRMEPRNTFTWWLTQWSTKRARLSNSSAHPWISRSSIKTGWLWRRPA
jgi:PAS domain-containing protein